MAFSAKTTLKKVKAEIDAVRIGHGVRIPAQTAELETTWGAGLKAFHVEHRTRGRPSKRRRRARMRRRRRERRRFVGIY